MINRDDTVRGGKSFDMPDRRASTNKLYPYSNSKRHDFQHPYRRSETGCFLEEFKKFKPPIFIEKWRNKKM